MFVFEDYMGRVYPMDAVKIEEGIMLLSLQ